MLRPAFILVAALQLAACAVQPVATLPAGAGHGTAALDAIHRLGKEGDWLVIRGIHDTDNLVATLTNKPFSHAAVLDTELDQVIEAEGIGIHTTPLAAFTAKAQRLLLVRPMWAGAEKSRAAVQQARDLVGRRYDYSGLVGIDDPSAYYCTELAMAVYAPHPATANPIPPVIEPGQLFYWGTIVYDTGPVEAGAATVAH